MMYLPGMLTGLLLVCVLPIAVHAEVILDKPFEKADSLDGWLSPKNGKIVLSDGIKVLEVKRTNQGNPDGSFGVSYPIPPAKAAGKRLIITAEIQRDIGIPLRRWQGGKFMLSIKNPHDTDWKSVYMEPGKFKWTKMKLSADIPSDALKVNLFLGIQAAKGEIRYRGLKIETTDSTLDFTPVANMGFADKMSSDGKGGWSDQGPDNDGAKFKFKSMAFGGIPFRVIDPKRNKGKSILVFRSPKFRNGLERAEIKFEGTGTQGKYLYLLHTLTYGQGKGATAGFIDLTGINGKKQTFEISDGRDVADWWRPAAKSNAFPASMWQNTSGGTVGVYTSAFKIDPALGKLKSVLFRSSGSLPVWIVLGATISEKFHESAKMEKIIAKPDAVWKELPTPPAGGVASGSALDLSFLGDPAPAGAYGRVIINSPGHFSFEKTPDKTVRFLSTAEGTDSFWGRDVDKSQFSTHEMIEEYARQLRRAGYNMVRLHFIDAVLMRKSKQALEFNPVHQDQLDYLVFQLKKNGIYINWDAMSSRIGYESGDPWGPSYNKYLRDHDKREFKYDIYHNPAVRKNWESGVRKFLSHVNPYTKLSYADEPALALAVGFNEQEFAFSMRKNFDKMLPLWKDFLKKKYASPETLAKAWNLKKLASFDDVLPFTQEEYHSATMKGRDITEFITSQEMKIYSWYRDTLRKAGFKGPVANFNMGKSLRNILVRRNSDYVAMNSYHAHPSAFWRIGSTIDQSSSIGNAGSIIRGFVSTRMAGAPFVITEHGHVFWNRYRYEQAFVTGAYSAFQDLDGLTAFASQVSIRPYTFIRPFGIKHDPVAKAGEFLTAFLFRREDVSPAKNFVRVRLDPEEVLKSNNAHDGLHSGQSRLVLTTGFRVDCGKRFPAAPGETFIERSGGAKLLLQSGYTNVLESADRTAFRFDDLIAQLKKEGKLPSGNRSSFDTGVFESSTGELFMDTGKNFMRVDTPRFQGVCGEAGTRAILRDLEIRNMSVRACAALVSVDAKKPISEAKRLVLVLATNALNGGMEFDGPERRVLLKLGTKKILLETGKFSIVFRNIHTASMKAYALGIDGKRLSELPVKRTSDGLEFTVDTSLIPNGPALYFEFISK